MNSWYAKTEPSRAEIDLLEGPTLVEFGAPWCGICRSAQKFIADALEGHPAVRHVKIEDGSGRPLGRSFGVKLWPTLVFLKQGREVARLVRPVEAAAIRAAIDQIEAAAPVAHM
jgi:thioredoxin 1